MPRTIGVVYAFLTVVLSACSEGSPPSKPVTAPMPTEAAGAKDGVAPTAAGRRVTPAQFHASNKHTWVGVAHNRAMDELRAEVRSFRPKDLCRVIERIAVDSRITGSAGAAAELRQARKAAFDQVGCRGNRSDTRRSAASDLDALHAASLMAAEDFELSAQGWALVDQVMAAGAGAATAADLATELAGITSAAAALPADEASVVEAAASVSLSSFEYWTQNAQAMADEMAAAYGTCVEGGGGDGCFYVTGRSIWRAAPAPPVQLASYAAEAPCFIDTDFIWSGDKWGAGVGLAIGLMTKSVQGAIIGLVGGAIAGSGGAAVWQYGKYLRCAFK
jgi:hypothetical protein